MERQNMMRVATQYQHDAIGLVIEYFGEEIPNSKTKMSISMERELKKHRCLAIKRAKMEEEFKRQEEALNKLKEKLLESPEINIEKEFKKINKYLEEFDPTTEDLEKTDETIREIDQRILALNVEKLLSCCPT